MKTKKRFLSILLSLVMVLGLMPGMSLTALAWDGDPYARLLNTTTVVKFDNKDWYLIENNSTAANAGTVTLLSKECVATSQYNSSVSYVEYASSTVKTAVDSWYNDNITSDAKTAVVDNKMFLLTTAQANAIGQKNPEVLKCNSGADVNAWWLCSPGSNAYVAACVYGGISYVDAGGCGVVTTLGVRPALKLNLESVIFSSESKTFSLKPAYSVTLSGGANATTSGGATSQTGLTGAMTTVTYTANTGYYFAEFADISSNGITARRTSSTVVTVSGTPTADATITVPDAVKKTAATVTKAPTAKSLTYTGSAQELVTAGEATGGTMQYAIGDANGAAQPYTTSIPSKTNAGTYYVWYKAKGDSNHIDSATASVIVTIAEKQTEAPVKETPDNPIDEAAPAKIQANASIQLNAGFLVYWKGSTVCVKWGKAPEADQFEIYAQYCGSKTCKKIMTVKSGNSASFKRLNGKKLNRKLVVKVYVVASKNGKEIGRTLLGHAAGSKNSHTNAKKVKVSRKSYTLTVGKSAKIKAKIVKAKSGKKLLGKGHCAKVRYTSSNTKVATVSKSGKIKAVGKGKCDIRIFAQNGRSCKVTVTVK